VNKAGQELDYSWDFGTVARYLFRHDPARDAWVPGMLAQGFFTTLRLSVWCVLLATPIGVAAGLARVRKGLLPRALGRAYVESMRNVPPLVLIFIGYFFVGGQLFSALGVEEAARALPPSARSVLTFFAAPPERSAAFFSAVATLALYEGAYVAEIVRAGVLSIERGQRDAAYALGLSPWQEMRHVVGPQAVQRMLPALAGQLISAIKDSAIVSVISIQELTFQGLQLMASTYLTFEIWITITLLYLALTLPCSLAARKLEARLRH
jgi:polar amino acid transport system permease protein